MVNKLIQFGQILIQTPGSNMRAFAKEAGRLMFRKAEVDKFLPQTIDELKAEAENELLNQDKLQGTVDGIQMKVEVDPTDDHPTHLEMHGKAADTKAKFAHIEAHKRAMMIQRNNPELFASLQPQGQPSGNGKPLPGPTPPPATLQGQVTDLRTS